MRYYIYLDKDFLRSLFAIFKNAEFNIDVFEFSIRNSYTLNNNISLDPSVENAKDSENYIKKDFEDHYSSTMRDNVGNRKKVGISYDNGNSYNCQTEKKYLNITDITDMKNMAFYHDLLEKIRLDMSRNDNDRIFKEIGYIKLNQNRDVKDELNKKDKFFMINDSFVWYDNTKLQADISLMQEMCCKIHVIGYKMNCTDIEDEKEIENRTTHNILKAIAMYIE